MKILLIQPAKAQKTIGGEDVFIYEPLALEYLASGVKEDHDVRILDMRIDKDLDSQMQEFKPDVVGITAYTVHVNTVKDLFNKIKTIDPGIFTVVGGHHATVAPEDFSNPYIDLIVMGEGVLIFKEIISRLVSKRPFDGIAGISYLKKGERVMNPPEPITDLDIFPFPAREFTEKYRKYYYSEWMRPLASIRTSKGCPNRCNFCALWKLTGGKYLKRKPENIVRELSGIKEKYVFFADDESMVDAKRMKILAELIREAGIKKRYFLYGRSDTIVKNPDLIKIWKEIGLERVFVGLEFFRDEDLKYINKGSTVENNKEAIKILNSNGIEIYASFIVRPDFNAEDFKEFKEYCRGMELNFASFAVLTPLPGTDLYEEVKDRLITHDYDLFDFLHTQLPTKLPLKEFFNNLNSLYFDTIPLGKSISLMRKYPLKEIPGLISLRMKVAGQMKNAYKDYEI
ncbi:MAG: radical SAM protein [Candidatus Methanoperedens sp.]|nr:radical SAM protein [Candidatus Methanoperedens sp.]CAG0962418.1 anaerobic magnesium-protoporphyrin IX monomethyl ester cyclase [Methanosarcinales archaeon]